jgi:hypothetical protein
MPTDQPLYRVCHTVQATDGNTGLIDQCCRTNGLWWYLVAVKRIKEAQLQQAFDYQEAT